MKPHTLERMQWPDVPYHMPPPVPLDLQFRMLVRSTSKYELELVVEKRIAPPSPVDEENEMSESVTWTDDDELRSSCVVI